MLPAGLRSPPRVERFGTLNLPLGGKHGYKGVAQAHRPAQHAAHVSSPPAGGGGGASAHPNPERPRAQGRRGTHKRWRAWLTHAAAPASHSLGAGSHTSGTGALPGSKAGWRLGSGV